MRGAVASTVGERTVGIGLFEQIHFRRAQRQRIAVVLAVMTDPHIAQIKQPRAKSFDTDQYQGPHRRHVE